MDEKTIGANIRNVREGAKITLTDLAGRAGITKGMLSKIETGAASASISSLMSIADALGIPLGEVFREPHVDPPYTLTRKGEGDIITMDGSKFGYSYQALALDRHEKQAEPFILTINPGDPMGEFQHRGEEFIYMLEGRLEFHVGDEVIDLKAGDSLYFNPQYVHKTRVLGKKTVRYLNLFIQSPRVSK